MPYSTRQFDRAVKWLRRILFVVVVAAAVSGTWLFVTLTQ